MLSTRRTILKAGLGGLFVSKASLSFAAPQRAEAFAAWQQSFERKTIERMEEAKIVGASVVIVKQGASSPYMRAFGLANVEKKRRLTTETPMHLASVSKLFTAAALVQLFDRHKLSLHDDVNKFISFTVQNPHFPDVPITPHQLLTHTSSISDEGYEDMSTDGDPSQSIESFLKSYLTEAGQNYQAEDCYHKVKPGAFWDYSNVAIALAGHIIEAVSGQSFSACIDEIILRPLKIENAHWYLKEFNPDTLANPYEFIDGNYVELPQEGYPDVPAGMMRCSINDLATFIAAMIGSSEANQSFLSDELIDEMLRRQISTDIVSYQGLGWVEEEINGKSFVGHSGRDTGASNMVVIAPDRQYAAIVLMNIEPTDATNRFREDTIDELLRGTDLLKS